MGGGAAAIEAIKWASDHFNQTYSSKDTIKRVVLTNSDHIFNGVRIAVLQGRVRHTNVAIYFFNAEGGVDRISLNQHGQCDRWPDGFFDAWDKALGTIIDGTAESYAKKGA